MIKKIILRDFMAHGHTELELGPGMTVLTGPNNSGKSAIVEALRCVATNPAPYNYIRHGAKEARVEVELDSGHRVVWIRRKTYAMYNLYLPGEDEPQEYAKFGRTPPEDILNTLKLNLVDIEGFSDGIDVHIGNQREPVFLLNRPGSAVAGFLASSSEAAYLLSMQNALKARTAKAKSEKNMLIERQAGLEAELDHLRGLPETRMEMDRIKDLDGRINDLAKSIPAMETSLARHRALCADKDRARRQLAGLIKITPAPALFPVSRLAEIVDAATRLGIGRKRNQNQSDILNKLENPPEAYPVLPLKNTRDRVSLARKTATRVSWQAKTLAKLEEPPELFPAKGLDDLLARREKLAKAEKKFESGSSVLDRVEAPPDLETLTGLLAMIRDLKRLISNRKNLETAVAKLGREADLFADKASKRIAEIKVCPTCGTALDPEKILETGGHGHE